MKILENSFSGKNILITGHTGFKGSWLCIWLKLLGANVIGYSLAPYTDKDNFTLSHLSSKIIDIRGDIRDSDNLMKIFEDYEPEIVFHLAAQPIVRFSYKNPKETYDVNVNGTINVLECIRKSRSVKVGIVVTSDKCYENKECLWGYTENDKLGGYDPYSASKAVCEIITNSYRNSFFNPEYFLDHGKSISSVRAGNVIGGGDWSKDRLIPDCIKFLEENKKIKIRNPYSIRPWQHVLEPLGGYLLLASKMLEDGITYTGAWNFGPDHEYVIPVKDIVGKIIKYWGNGNFTCSQEGESKWIKESNLLLLNCNKAKKLLGWNPILNIDETIFLTVEWYKNYKKTDIYLLCLEQIKSYINVKPMTF